MSILTIVCKDPFSSKTQTTAHKIFKKILKNISILNDSTKIVFKDDSFIEIQVLESSLNN
jgi:hypothetical protein